MFYAKIILINSIINYENQEKFAFTEPQIEQKFQNFHSKF